MKYAALGVVYVVGGSTYLAIRLTIESLPPLLSGGVRVLLAGAVLAAVVAVVSRGGLRMTRAQFGTAAHQLLSSPCRIEWWATRPDW